MAKDTQTCSFCGRPAREVGTLVAGINGSFICPMCVETLHNAFELRDMEDRAKRMDAMLDFDIKTPSQLKKGLDEYVVGQEEAKKILSVAVYNHYKRLRAEMLNVGDEEYPDVEIEKATCF